MKLLLQPLPVRIFHWVMVFCIMTLLITGLYLHAPLPSVRLPITMIRKIHSISGFMLAANLLGQIYYYNVTKKFTEVLFLPADVVNLPSFVRYVLFITGGHPNYGRYNPGQKALFTLWSLAVLTASFTSTTLLFPDFTLWFQKLLGGLNHVRVIHFLIAVLFISTIPLHLYLVFTEDPAKLQAIFTGYINKEPSGNESESTVKSD